MTLVAIEELIKNKIGIDSQIVGSESLHYFIRRRMEAENIGAYQEYFEVLENSSQELQLLINLITIPETWFFRDTEPFKYLKNYIEEYWLSQDSPEVLSVLSVPCSTGEEPYSIAMALTECGLLPEAFHIDAYDINHVSLEKAKLAIYGNNSFRGYDLAFREKFFDQVNEGFQIKPRIRDSVNFYHGNAVNILKEVSGRVYDIIFCRNLLIYFDRTTQKCLLTQLQRLLVPNGRLFLGHAESNELVLSRFSSVGGKGSFAYVKRQPGSSWLDVEDYATNQLSSVYGAGRTGRKNKRVKTKNQPVTKKVRQLRPIDNSLIRDIERKADSGELEEAARLCELLAQQGIEDANALCLCGVINEVRGELEKAGDMFNRAIEIDPNHYDALVHLAESLEVRGQSEQAAQLRKRAKAIASDKEQH